MLNIKQEMLVIKYCPELLDEDWVTINQRMQKLAGIDWMELTPPVVSPPVETMFSKQVATSASSRKVATNKQLVNEFLRRK